MDEDEALMTLGVFLIQNRRRQRNKQKVKKNRAMWVRGINKHREEKGAYQTPWCKSSNLEIENFISLKK